MEKIEEKMKTYSDGTKNADVMKPFDDKFKNMKARYINPIGAVSYRW